MDNFKINANNPTNLFNINPSSANRTDSEQKTSDVKSDFAKLLAEKKSNIKKDLEDMQRLRAEIQFNQSFHEILTGKPVENPVESTTNLKINTLEILKVELETKMQTQVTVENSEDSLSAEQL